jgi:hypothetical protein
LDPFAVKLSASSGPETSKQEGPRPAAATPHDYFGPHRSFLVDGVWQWRVPEFGVMTTRLRHEGHKSPTPRYPATRVAAVCLDAAFPSPDDGISTLRSASQPQPADPRVGLRLRQLHRDGWDVVLLGWRPYLDGATPPRVAAELRGIAKAILSATEPSADDETSLGAFDCAVVLSVASAAANGASELLAGLPGMWRQYVRHCRGGVAPSRLMSLVVGRSATRDAAAPSALAPAAASWDDADNAFAAAVGIEFIPVEVFLNGDHHSLPSQPQ